MSFQSRSVRQADDWSLWLGKVGMWLAIVSFGGTFWSINGGFSVLGLEVLSRSFNGAGSAFWFFMSSFTFPVPFEKAGIKTQPIVPWLGVIAASWLQILVTYRRLKNMDVTAILWIITILLSIYDFVTTYYGLGTVSWVADLHWIVRFGLGFLLTFILEATVGYMLKETLHGPSSTHN